MKVAAAVIIYNPDNNVVRNIESYARHVNTIYIYDNTENPTSEFAEKVKHLPHVRLFHNGQNKGIAKRLNEACERALAENNEWLLAMDQDSSFDENAIDSYFKCFYSYGEKQNTAVIGPYYEGEYKESSTDCTITRVDHTITSGMLINLQLFRKIGGFDENLFIDFVDTEYCIKAGMQGFGTIRFDNIFLTHSLGTRVNRSSIKTLFLVKKEKLIHSYLRCYYCYRNMLYLEAKYKQSNPGFVNFLRPYIKGFLSRNLFYGRSFFKTIKYLITARQDFKNGKMGKKQ